MTFSNSLVVCSALVFAFACGGSKPEAEPPPAPSAPMQETPPALSPDAGARSMPPPAPASSAEPVPAAATPKMLVADFAPKSGSKLTGKVTATEEPAGVKLVIEIAGATPGEHGAHVHETPDCSAPDAKSAGSHYNPDKHDHGLPDAKARHLGDLGNISVGKDGKGKLEIVIPDANLRANDPHSFVGRSVIVHEKKDDGGQPVGNAGGRIGCAVIKG